MNTTTLILAGGAALALLYVATHNSSANLNPLDFMVPNPYGEDTQTTSIADDLMVTLTPSTYIPANVPEDQAARNVSAFLDMLAYSEGTSGDNGYRMLFGGGLFDSFADHPRIYVPFRNTSSSAAGRYQILARTWDVLKARLNLPDFSPESQDAAAVELIRERGALNDVKAGRLADAITKCARVWASLPGAGYNQPERKLASLQSAFAAAGGNEETTA